MIQILSTSEKPLSASAIKEAHNIMRIAYESTEEEIWGKNYERLFLEDFSELVEKGEIFVAYKDGSIVGSVHVYAKDKETFKFSLLSVSTNYGGKGVGTALVQRAEEEAKTHGASQVKIEILRVRGVDVPHKLRLHDYYIRLGYEHTHSSDSSCLIPAWKHKLLVAPSDFDFFCKKL